MFADDRIPVGYDMVFILYSDTFQGQTDATRQIITLRPDTLKMLQKTFRDEILALLTERAPKVIEETKHEAEQINDQFPHLRGYFEENTIGISSKAKGYQYLIDAIELIIKEPRQCLCRIIGEKYSKSDVSVERAMQNAINRAWKTNDIDVLLCHFTAKINSEKGVPTITEFVYYYANKIKNEY